MTLVSCVRYADVVLWIRLKLFSDSAVVGSEFKPLGLNRDGNITHLSFLCSTLVFTICHWLLIRILSLGTRYAHWRPCPYYHCRYQKSQQRWCPHHRRALTQSENDAIYDHTFVYCAQYTFESMTSAITWHFEWIRFDDRSIGDPTWCAYVCGPCQHVFSGDQMILTTSLTCSDCCSF